MERKVETTMSYKRYTKEFKQKVLREVELGEGASAVARRYAVSRQLIHEWQQRKRDGTLQDTGVDLKAQLEREVSDLQRKVGQLTMENEFLKKTLECLETRYPQVQATAESKRSSKWPKDRKPVSSQ
jgi:transposase-like protein